MPLSFNSTSHGRIAFGFFNIESDMLLLERYFFFADRFCDHVTLLVNSEAGELDRFAPVYHISRPDHIGDLRGAIHGLRYNGFIGALYRRFPFPEAPENFKQHPDGHKNQEIVRDMIQHYADVIEIPFSITNDGNARIGPYRFDRAQFHDLIRYVWQGGYPRWRNGIRPDYVWTLRKSIEQSPRRLGDVCFDDESFSIPE